MKYKKMFFIILIVMTSLTITLIYFNSVTAITDDEERYIYIDPGHGGNDGGAVSKTEVYEKDINLLISYHLKTYLENSGYIVKMTRYADYDLASYNSKNRKHEDITKRVKLINNENVILFVSIHCNIYTSEKIYGAQTFYSNPNSETLAYSIQNKLKNILKNTNREIKKITGKYLLDNSTTVGCLVEVGFLSNPNELQLLTKSAYQEKIAYSIYIGIIDYLGV